MNDLNERIARLSPEKRALFEQHFLKKRNAPSLKRQLICRRGTADPCMLSFAQQRLWFLDQLEPGIAAYNIFSTIRLTGQLNVTALERSFGEILRRHEALRTTFVTENDEPLQKIAPVATFTLRR
ncbi:MAG TPA: condensation domain-containing protein, partial [Thermodesulfovibrionales bacterium]|nr:condensation domain-containing protein [Thermodesulfovibrionales bacterium]